jgi:DNA-binding transcriptional MerR regulator
MDEEVRLILFVLQAKGAGFHLEEIQEIIHLSLHGSACDYVRETLSGHIGKLEVQIAELTRLRANMRSALA